MTIKTIGIYAYTKGANDTFGGVESHVTHLSKTLVSFGYNVVIHCLAASGSGLHVQQKKFTFGELCKEISPGLTVYTGVNGPGIEGCVEENIEISTKKEEEVIFCFGTRDGFVFDVAIEAKNRLKIPMISFVYFTIEERWFRAQFGSRTRSIPGVASKRERDELFESGALVVDKVVKNSDLIVAPTNYVRAQILAITSVEYSAKTFVSYHGISDELFDRRPSKWAPKSDFMIVARLGVPFACHKGFLWAAELVSEHLGFFEADKVFFCGDGSGAEYLKEFSRDLGLDEHIKILGFLNQAELVTLYRKCKYLIVPSMMEAGSTTTVEAVASGCLPIALDVGGLSEIMEQIGLRRYLLPGCLIEIAPGVKTIVPDAQAFLDLIVFCKNNPSVVSDELRESQRIVKEHYLLSKTTKHLLSRLSGENYA